jgi:hypothetical protein
MFDQVAMLLGPDIKLHNVSGSFTTSHLDLSSLTDLFRRRRVRAATKQVQRRNVEILRKVGSFTKAPSRHSRPREDTHLEKLLRNFDFKNFYFPFFPFVF